MPMDNLQSTISHAMNAPENQVHDILFRDAHGVYVALESGLREANRWRRKLLSSSPGSFLSFTPSFLLPNATYFSTYREAVSSWAVPKTSEAWKTVLQTKGLPYGAVVATRWKRLVKSEKEPKKHGTGEPFKKKRWADRFYFLTTSTGPPHGVAGQERGGDPQRYHRIHSEHRQHE